MVKSLCIMKKAFVSTSGCALLHVESQAYIDHLMQNGWEITPYPSGADFILLNLCCLNHKRKQEHINYINRIKTAREKNTKIAITGCISTIAAEEIEALGVDARITLAEQGALDGIIGADRPLSDLKRRHFVRINPFLAQLRVLLQNNFFGKVLHKCRHPASLCGLLYYLNIPAEHDLSGSFCVTIMSGCSNSCSYCAIRFARGRPKSVPSADIIGSIRQGLRQGYKKVHLLGTNPTEYGVDINNEVDYSGLIAGILEIPAHFKLVLPDVDPGYFVKKFDCMRGMIKSGRILEITFALQSGSSSVLSRMKRHYDIRRFKECVREARSLDRRLKINSHIIVGFPGETGDEFEDTFGLLREADFDKVMLFEYGDFAIAESSRMPGHVPHAEIRRRMNAMHKYLLFSYFKRLFRAAGEEGWPA